MSHASSHTSPPAQPPLIIVNPASAGGATGRRWPRFAPLALQALPEAEITHTQAKGEATRLVREGVERGVRHFVAVGGDGTAHEVMQGMLSEQGEPLTDQASDPLTLSVLPMGTGSDFCRSLGLPRDPREAIKHLTAAPRPIDIGWVSWGGAESEESAESAEGTPFINVASFGLSGHVAREVEAKGKGGQLAYLASLFTSARGYQNAPLAFTLTLEDHSTLTLERVCYTCALGNARYFGGGMPITPTALLDDGLLELVIVGDLSLPEVTLRLPSLYQGTHVSKPKFERYAVRALEVRPLGDDPVWLELDGEPQRALPARFEVRPRALSVTTGPRPPALSPSLSTSST